ncbi:MAG TPA: DUF4258 domain-containing protein [Nitrospiria bacterium]|jgi:hypothetical protein
MKIEEIKTKIKTGSFRITDHALIESFKDGLTVADILYALNHGKIIEEYPHWKRCLIYGKSANKVPIHVVIDYSWEEEIDIVTVYIPDPRHWIRFQTRKKKGPKHEKK